MSTVIQIWQGEPIDAYSAMMADVKESALAFGHDYVLDRMAGDFVEHETAARRVKLACEIPDMIYVDADVSRVDWSAVPAEGAAFCEYCGSPDYFFFVVGGDTDFFEWMISEKERRHLLDSSFWVRKVLRSSIVQTIHGDVFDHHRLNNFAGA